MNDAELRTLVRESIARHLAGGTPSNTDLDTVRAAHAPHADLGAHAVHGASHLIFPLERGDHGACLIEPAVRCNHCGYCLSYGH